MHRKRSVEVTDWAIEVGKSAIETTAGKLEGPIAIATCNSIGLYIA